MRISDWSSDVCSSDLTGVGQTAAGLDVGMQQMIGEVAVIAAAAMMLDYGKRGVFAQFQHMAQVADQFGFGRSADEQQMQRGVDRSSRFQRDQRTLGGESGVDARDNVGDASGRA